MPQIHGSEPPRIGPISGLEMDLPDVTTKGLRDCAILAMKRPVPVKNS